MTVYSSMRIVYNNPTPPHNNPASKPTSCSATPTQQTSRNNQLEVVAEQQPLPGHPLERELLGHLGRHVPRDARQQYGRL